MERNSILALLLLLSIGVLSACGAGAIKLGDSSDDDDDDGDEPAAVSVTLADADGSTTIADPSSLTLTFSTDMDASSLTTPGNVTLACGSLTPSITVASTSTRVFTVAVADAYKYQLLSCTLTLTTNVRTNADISAAKASGGTALPQPITATFTISGCAVSDDFNSDTQGCWTVSTAGGYYDDWTTWPELIADGILAFDTAGSDLDYANSEVGTTGASILKTVAINPSGFQITLSTDAISGFTTGIEFGQPDMFYAALTKSDFTGSSLMVGFGKMDDEDARSCFVLYYEGDDDMVLAADDCNAACASGPCAVRVTVQNKVITAAYSTGGGAFQPIPVVEGDFPTDEDFADKTAFGFMFHNIGGTDSAAIDSVVVSGITSSTQY